MFCPSRRELFSSHVLSLFLSFPQERKLASLEEFVGDWGVNTSQRALSSLQEMIQEYLQYHDFANTLECFQAEALSKKYDGEANKTLGSLRGQG